MGVFAGLYMYDVVVKKFKFASSSPDEFLYKREMVELDHSLEWSTTRFSTRSTVKVDMHQ